MPGLEKQTNVNTESRASASLLLKIRKGNAPEEAWCVFVERYGSRIFQWCLSRGLQSHDALDVSQDVLLKLARNLKTFEYDPARSFQGWLHTITENALNDHFRERQRNHSAEHAFEKNLSQTEARQDLVERIGEAFDLEMLEQQLDRREPG